MTMKTLISKTRRGFTLVELLVAMAITALLVLVIMQLILQGLNIWKDTTEEVETRSRARAALITMGHDFESMQIRMGDNKYQWFFAKSDNSASGAIKKIKIPRSTQCVFFASALDRSPSVGSDDNIRSNYRTARAHNADTQGDVNAVGYRLLYRDQILNIDGKSGSETGAFPLFSLYRHLVSPRKAYQDLLGKENLEQAYVPFEQKDEENFLCENIIEMNLVLSIDYANTEAQAEDSRVEYEQVLVPIINSRGKGKDVAVYGDRIEVAGTKYEGARIVSVNISVTVVTEEGMNLIDQVRKGRRKAPKPAEFFREYTRSYSTRVSPPEIL